jgi:hypothetical protein
LKKKNTEDQSEIKKQLDELIEITEYLQQKDVENVFSITYEELGTITTLTEMMSLNEEHKPFHRYSALSVIHFSATVFPMRVITQ